MRTLTVTTAGVDFRFEGGNVRATRNGEAIRQFTCDLSALVVLAIAYLEMNGLRSASRGSSIVTATSYLCRWVQDILLHFRQQRGNVVPLPYRLYLIPGQALTFGKLQVKRLGLDAPSDPYRLDDQFSVSVSGEGLFVVDEASFTKLMNCLLIELAGPIWSDLDPKVLAGDRAQQSPGFKPAVTLLGAWNWRMRLVVLLFRPVALVRTAWRLATLRSEAATVRKMVAEAYTAYRTEAEAYARQIGEEAARIAEERQQLDTATAQLGQQQDSIAQERRGMDSERREHVAALRRMQEAHELELRQGQEVAAAAEENVERLKARLLLWQTRYADLLTERNCHAASLGIPATPLPEELQHLTPPCD